MSKTPKKGYQIGQHGAKKKEQKRLSNKYDIEVTGKSHESEHTVGFEPISRGSKEKRGKSTEIRKLENEAPAYQEKKKFHRSHIGTGNKKKEDESGFNSQSYRDSQRKLLEDSDVSSAVQLNQLGYAFLKGFQEEDSVESKASDDSYDKMVENMEDLQYLKEDEKINLQLSPIERVEMYLARKVAKTGKWPTEEEIKEAKKKFGIND